MNFSSSENRLVDARISYLEESYKEISKKCIKIQHNLIAFQGIQLFLQNAIQNVVSQLEQLKQSKTQQANYGLSEMTHYSNSANKNLVAKQNLSKSSNPLYSHFLQLFQSLQTSTINNLQQLENKINTSYQSIESKCQKMQLRMLGIWKEAQNLIQNLTFDVQTSQVKCKSMQERSNRDRQMIFNTIKSFENQLQSFSISHYSKFSQQITQTRSFLQNQIQSLSQKVQSLNISQRLDIIKTDIQKSVKKNYQKVIDNFEAKLQQNLKCSPDFQSDFKLTVQNQNTKIDQLQKQIQQTHRKLNELQKQLKDKVAPRDNWRNKFKENSQQSTQKKQQQKDSQKFISLNNSQGPQDPWSSNSIDVASKKPQNNTKFQTSNKNYSQNNSNPFEKGFSNKNKLISVEKPQKKQKIQEKEGDYVRGIAGLRNMRKKEEQKKSSLQRNRNFYDQHKPHFDPESRNPLSRGGNLRQLPVLQSPSKTQSHKALPPLSSQKGIPKSNPMQRQTNIAAYQNYSQSPQNDSDGSESYFVDEEGFLIDKEGNRLINQNGQQVQLSYEDIERLREMEQEEN